MSLIEELFGQMRAKIEQERLMSPLVPFPDCINYIDQTALPFRITTLSLSSPDEMSEAIREMKIRGSGAIGIAAGFGAYLAVQLSPNNPDLWEEHVKKLRMARPTANILQHAINEVFYAAGRHENPGHGAAEAAVWFFENQLKFERAIGSYGAAVVPDGATILTHCHSGALAGAGYGGRALSVIRAASEAGKHIRVISQETRPYLQGARITSWELHNLGIPVSLSTDGMSGALMEMGQVDVCIVGSDRLAMNGDLVNKVGTYLIALAAREHNIPFYTATTHYNVDRNCNNGKDIPIELRPGNEVLFFRGEPITIKGVDAIYPAFDITPSELITGIITETGILKAPYISQLESYINIFRI